MANPVYIQGAISANPSVTSATTIALAYSTQNLVAGSILSAYCTWGTADTTPTCADNTPQTWSAGPKLWDSTNSQGFAIFYFKNNASTVKPTVTVTFPSQTPAFRGLHIAEVGPADTGTQPDVAGPAFNTQNSPATTTDLVASNAIVVATTNALLMGFTGDDNGVSQPVSGTGFANRSGFTGGVPSRLEDKTVSSGSTTATFTAGATGTRAITGVMAFRPDATAGAQPRALNPTLQAVSRASYY